MKKLVRLQIDYKDHKCGDVVELNKGEAHALVKQYRCARYATDEDIEKAKGKKGVKKTSKKPVGVDKGPETFTPAGDDCAIHGEGIKAKKD